MRIVKKKEKNDEERDLRILSETFWAEETVHANADWKINLCYSGGRAVIRGPQDGEQVAEREHAVFFKFFIELGFVVSLPGCF